MPRSGQWATGGTGASGFFVGRHRLHGCGKRPLRSCDSQCAKGWDVAWLMLVCAGLLEMVWSYSAKQADGFKHLGWGGITIVSSLASFFLLVFAMKSLPLGTAYSVWTGIGAVGSFAIGIWLLGESAAPARIGCALLIVAGVVGLRLTSS